jgi:fructose/tagatose bisphosphate aldolase
LTDTETTMKTLREVLQDAEKRRVAVGHFNFSELTVLKAVGEAHVSWILPLWWVCRRANASL